MKLSKIWHRLAMLPGFVLAFFTLVFFTVAFTLAFTLALLTSARVSAAFDPAVLSQSTVRILIKTKQGVVGAASGFLWQSEDQIVTSLHVMSNDPKARIIVEFGKVKRKATIMAVLPKADLVLLKIKRPVPGWLPLTKYNAAKPKYKSDISALGFNRGALGMSTRELRKGFVNPEQLQVLLPPDAVQNLIRSKVLDVKLPIYYLDGSLLPGYSGSPVVDDEGVLIGIGDGGLESGAASVSWVIPASNLDQLMASTLTETPASLELLGPVFSGDVAAALSPEHRSDLFLLPNRLAMAGLFADISSTRVAKRFESGALQAIGKRLNFELPGGLSLLVRALSGLNPIKNAPGQALIVAQADAQDAQDEWGDQWVDESNIPNFTSVKYQQFDFIKVKSRTYQQMLASSGSPVNMNKVFAIYQQFFYDYQVDYRQFVFNVYEDGRFGLNIAIPQGTELVVDENDFLLVQGEMFCRTCSYEIQYHARELDVKAQQAVLDKPRRFLSEVAQSHWGDLNNEGDFGEYIDFRDIEAFGSGRYVLRAAYTDLEEPFKEQYEFNYFTAAANRDAWFQAQGILNRFDQAFFADLDKYRGTDCRQVTADQARAAVCHDIETMLKILISVHLTSFSNKFYGADLS